MSTAEPGVKHEHGIVRHGAHHAAMLKRDPYVRPYKQFVQGGVHRFRGGDLVFRPFRVA